MPGHRPRILLTSAGSLLGRCILDSLAGRRNGVRLVCADADPRAAALAEGDATVVLPLSDDPEFPKAVEALCRERDVDLVIPGRDPDALALASLGEDPASSVNVLGPPGEFVRIARDKWRTWQWCMSVGIPFVPTIRTAAAHADVEVAKVVAEWGLPLICKPRDGSGSLGVTVLTTEEQVASAVRRPGLVVQPFIDPPPNEELRIDTSVGVPLFWEVPVAEFVVSAAIGPDGEIGPTIACRTDHRLGRVERVIRSDDPELEDFAEDVARRARDAGWRGPLNVSCRRGPYGYLAFEINPRFSGSTSSRLLLGQDEVGWLVNEWLGAEVIPAFAGPVVDEVARTFAQYPTTAYPLSAYPAPASGSDGG